jgi:TatD DNase family protein
MFLSFSGIVTFKAAADVRAAAALCPLDRVLVETDSPYLAPVPHRGRPNRPAFVPLVGAAVAAAAGVDVDAVASATWANAERAYRLAAATTAIDATTTATAADVPSPGGPAASDPAT